ncbi:hypothetical protein SAC12B_0054 [Lactobacillus phage SAC12B]|uniref:Uncharacterized protein n=1 Tax=Lactobacillus phage SAC12B TaxID=2510941 RepID=A0A4Y5FFE1_9CAUD|nr:hypothetical protein HWC10_gp054 [Lactobacillus phage SAC12B]QBJ03843.1 hypothetical protein SAC12B_0054 [Lactobacillus phage SAC12B]
MMNDFSVADFNHKIKSIIDMSKEYGKVSARTLNHLGINLVIKTNGEKATILGMEYLGHSYKEVEKAFNDIGYTPEFSLEFDRSSKHMIELYLKLTDATNGSDSLFSLKDIIYATNMGDEAECLIL